MSAEPTAEQWETAMVACGHRGWTTEQLSLTQRERVENVARALAAAVTAEREKYLRVADELEELGLRRAVNAHTSGRIDAARRIREVTT